MRPGKTHQIKEHGVESLDIALKTSADAACGGPPSATRFGLADIRSKTNLSEVTDPRRPIPRRLLHGSR